MQKNRCILLLVFLFICFFRQAEAQKIERMEPICWWAGMKTDLQLMIYGENLQNAAVKVLEEGLSVKTVHNAESPNYLFVDLNVLKAGKYTLEITKGKKKTKAVYEILPRRKNAAERKGFSPEDVIYLIMPDRFANGDVSNDVVNGSVLDRQNLEERHGGDIQGIINHLDYLADLGVTTIWSTPVLEDSLYYHQYGVTDYYKIDPHIGDNELYKKLVAESHKKGLKVIQDMTPNHCGINHWWIKDLPFADWINDLKLPPHYALFSLESLSDSHASMTDQKFTGSTILYSSMPDMNLLNSYVLKYLSQWAIWWIEYADLDGLRIDTYFYMGKKEAALWTQNILNEYPNLSLVGEVWGTDPAILSYWVGSTNNYDGFSSHLPMVMDFPFHFSLVDDLSGKKTHWGGPMRTFYNTIAQDFVYKKPKASQVIFADNHDTDRIYNLLGKDREKVKLAMTLVATMRGLPQIFYGTELLFEDDPKGGPHKQRPDFPGGWPGDTLNLFDVKNRTPEQQEMFNHIRTLLHFRKQTPVVYNGKLMHYIPLNGVYTYFRYDDNDCVMVIINSSETSQLIDWERFEERLSDQIKGCEILTGKEILKGTKMEIPAKSSMVIKFNEKIKIIK